MWAVCTWVGRKNRVLNGGPGPPRKWHLGGRTPTHMALFVLDILGHAWGVRTPTEMALFVLDILRRAHGPGSPTGRALFVGIYLDMLGPARGRCTQRYSQRTATMRPLATNIAAACFCFRRQTFFCLFFRRSLRRRESIARSFA